MCSNKGPTLEGRDMCLPYNQKYNRVLHLLPLSLAYKVCFLGQSRLLLMYHKHVSDESAFGWVGGGCWFQKAPSHGKMLHLCSPTSPFFFYFPNLSFFFSLTKFSQNCLKLQLFDLDGKRTSPRHVIEGSSVVLRGLYFVGDRIGSGWGISFFFTPVGFSTVSFLLGCSFKGLRRSLSSSLSLLACFCT